MTKRGGKRRNGKLEGVDEIIRTIFAEGRFGGSAQIAELWGCWKEIVGEDLAEHCFPERIKSGKLYIKSDSPIWRQQLDLLKEEIEERLGEKLENVKIEKLVTR